MPFILKFDDSFIRIKYLFMKYCMFLIYMFFFWITYRVLCGFLLMLCALGTLMDICGRPSVSLVSQTVSNKYVDEVSTSVQNEEVLHNERAFQETCHEDGYNQHNKNHIRTPLVTESVKSNYLRPKRPSGI